MLNKLSFNLAKELNESETRRYRIKKKVLIESDHIREEEIKEDTEEYLDTRYDPRKSFYKKARVITKDNGDEELYSYDTHVGGIRGGKPYSKGKYSQTTTRHQKEFFKQRGYELKDVPIELDEKYIEFPTEEEKDKYITDNKLKKGKDYIDKGINAIELLNESNLKEKHNKSLKEKYSEKLGGDSEDFVNDVTTIKSALEGIDTNSFSSKLAQQMVWDWIETCNYQIEKGNRLTKGEFNESEKVVTEAKEKPIVEAAETEVKDLQVIKEQGNIYMLEDKSEGTRYIVGENYNLSEGEIENAEIYDSKEEADKDYLNRCDIIKDGEEFNTEEDSSESEETTKE